MADQIILLTRDDQAQAIVDAFAERTGLQPEPVDGGVAFPLADGDHAIPVTQTLTDIDAGWADHVALGDPAGTDSA